MNTKVQTIFTPEGEAKKWKTLAGRVPEFLDQFPVKEGWQHDRQVVEACSLTPLLVELYKAAIVAGKNPRDVGLPPLPKGVVFIDRLLDPNGRVVASASAASQAESLFLPAGQSRFRDYEAGESAAFQRLLATLGIGGEVFDDDEANTIRSMGGCIEGPLPDDIPGGDDTGAVSSGASQVAAASVVAFKRAPTKCVDTDDLPVPESPEEALATIGMVVSEEERTETNHADPAISNGLPEALPVAEATQMAVAEGGAVVSSPANAPAADVTVTPKGRAAGSAQVLAAMNRNIKLMADQAGVTYKPATSIVEAKAAQAELLKSLRTE